MFLQWVKIKCQNVTTHIFIMWIEPEISINVFSFRGILLYISDASYNKNTRKHCSKSSNYNWNLIFQI